MRLWRNLSIILVAVWLIGCRGNDVSSAVSVPLSLEIASEIAAGEFVVAIVQAESAESAQLIWQDGYITRQFNITLVEGIGSQTITNTQTAGQALLTAIVGDASQTATIAIRPSSPTEPLTPLVSPDSVDANNAESVLAAAVPFDQFGNLIQNGTPITFTARRPDGYFQTYPTVAQHGVGWREISSGNIAGQTIVSVRAAEAIGIATVLEERAGDAHRVSLAMDETVFSADGISLVTLKTDFLQDRFGNQLADGTLVEFELIGDTTTTLPAMVIRGIAETSFTTPIDPQAVELRARIGNVMSDSETLMFIKSVQPFTASVDFERDTNSLHVYTPTLRDENGTAFPDGSIGRIDINHEDVLVRSVLVRTEFGRIDTIIYFPDAPNGAYLVEVTVGGFTAQTRIFLQ